MNIENLSQKDYENIIILWEKSVRITHTFLKESDIETIKNAVYTTLIKIALFGIKGSDELCGFMGASFDEIEALFVNPKYFSQGIGKNLMLYAIKELHLKKVCVNEQNKNAFNFYRKFGFKIIKKDTIDPLGLPYPILHLELT
ncbi:MAG: GNAT family N-acetyltransferase [Endomicrobium sp.]|jgi:putative acetyltransferase|nr:GNAT family N-acetyltransferase [Endomicrobium sp.]